MEIWRSADEILGQGLPRLIDRAARAGCPLITRSLRPTADPGNPDGLTDPLPVLLWQEADDSTARAGVLHAGVHDVIGPWMDPDEALARLLRMARMAEEARAGRSARMVLGDLDIDLLDHSARRGNRPLGLLAREYELLLHLARHCGHVQSRETLLRAIWRLAFDPGTNVVQVHVSRLRAKLDRGFARPMLHTVRGAGYCLVPES